MLTLVIVPVVYTLFDAMSNSRLMGFLGRKIFVANNQSSDDVTSKKSHEPNSDEIHNIPGVAKNIVG
jgi:hypothetical protein